MNWSKKGIVKKFYIPVTTIFLNDFFLFYLLKIFNFFYVPVLLKIFDFFYVPVRQL